MPADPSRFLKVIWADHWIGFGGKTYCENRRTYARCRSKNPLLESDGCRSLVCCVVFVDWRSPLGEIKRAAMNNWRIAIALAISAAVAFATDSASALHVRPCARNGS